ncbi:hypothetical protein ACRALDRAFT_207882 [Sodiomyces alcalophilus JCM 7366]|uniref:uncharacterized protein n=1 Tax=Sodiomyces alcalophilus JCM 7366 TaxID=591952 RepID=UPI0039B46AE1
MSPSLLSVLLITFQLSFVPPRHSLLVSPSRPTPFLPRYWLVYFPDQQRASHIAQ